MNGIRQRARRWLYGGGRPNGLARVMNRADAWLYSTGVLLPGRLVTLEVPGRRSGRLVSVPLVVADHDGERYLVAMLGEDTGWVRNVRAAVTWPSPRGRGRTCRWTGGPRWPSSSRSRRRYRSSASQPTRPCDGSGCAGWDLWPYYAAALSVASQREMIADVQPTRLAPPMRIDRVRPGLPTTGRPES
jgi:hypothetical protein